MTYSYRDIFMERILSIEEELLDELTVMVRQYQGDENRLGQNSSSPPKRHLKKPSMQQTRSQAVFAARMPAGSGEPIQYNSVVDQSDLSNAAEMNPYSLQFPKAQSLNQDDDRFSNARSAN